MPNRNRAAFTLIELLVVIAIIALLVGILLPSLSSTRNEARATKCSASLKAVASGTIIYSIDFRVLPPSYVYPDAAVGQEGGQPDKWTMANQGGSGSPTGYMHWSYLLFRGGGINEGAFTCPSVQNTGAPRSNPGSNLDHWEPEQLNDGQQPAPDASIEDRQVARLAFTANDAVMPRNKFVSVNRPYRLVRPSDIDGSIGGASKTILATEFLSTFKWDSLYSGSGSQPNVIKSHRPVSPIIPRSAALNEPFQESLGGSVNRFTYAQVKDLIQPGDSTVAVIDSTPVNAVGRHHPPTKGNSGTVNFSFVDGSVSRSTVQQTVEKQLWGDRYFSLTGNNKLFIPPRN